MKIAKQPIDDKEEYQDGILFQPNSSKLKNEEILKKVTVWYSIQNGGDGSAYPFWFLTEVEAIKDQDEMAEGWGEDCCGPVETFIGSDIHKEAVSRKNRKK
jgi:hypothetical protein